MMDRCGIIVTARVKSTRLPEKVLARIKNRYAIEILLDHVIADDNKYQVILAIPESKENDILEQIAIDKGVDVYRGYDDSPLHRLYHCAVDNDFQHVVRITADDILIDQTLMRNQIKFHIRGGLDYTYMKQCPEGIAGEVIKVSALKKVIEKVGSTPVEFVSYYLKNDKFIYKEYFPPYEYKFSYRLTMDYEEDLTLLRLLHVSLSEPIGTLDIVNFLKNHKYFLQINHLPQVTIYTCNYNTSKYIRECIDSVIAQTFGDIEYIVIDDKSTDDSMNVIMEWYTTLPEPTRKRVKVLRNDRNIGLSASSNRALKHARGRYIMRLDSDDVLLPEAVETMIETLDIENAQAVLSGYYDADEDMKATGEVLENRWHPASCLISKWCVNEIGYKEDVKYLDGPPFWESFRKNYKVAFVEKPLWKYRHHDSQKTAQSDHPCNSGAVKT